MTIIALCHFELCCKELVIEGKFEVLQDFPVSDGIKYVISWIYKKTLYETSN